MPANTAGKALPYPLPSEPVSAGAENIRKLAQSVDNMVQSGTVNTGTMVAGTAVDVPVVFPVAYAAVPTVVVTALGTAPENTVASVTSNAAGLPTATGFTVRAKRISGTAAFDVAWVAIGKVGLVALAADEAAPESEPETT